MSETLSKQFDLIHQFVIEELENRERSFLPDPTDEESGYIGSAKAAERAVTEARETADALLAVLKAALIESGCDGDLCMYNWHETARAAISKAEGGK